MSKLDVYFFVVPICFQTEAFGDGVRGEPEGISIELGEEHHAAPRVGRVDEALETDSGEHVGP